MSDEDKKKSKLRKALDFLSGRNSKANLKKAGKKASGRKYIKDRKG